jgi:hypothetical protein
MNPIALVEMISVEIGVDKREWRYQDPPRFPDRAGNWADFFSQNRAVEKLCMICGARLVAS